MPNMPLIESIHTVWLDLAETKSKIKQAKTTIKDIEDENDDWVEIKEETKALAARKKEVKRELEGDSGYQMANAELEELKYKFKDLQEILSHHLVEYYGEDHAAQIEDPEGVVRELIVSAKPGKPTLEQQELFDKD